MKKLIILMTVALAAIFAAPQAEARSYHSRSYVKYHQVCKGPAWVETYVAYRDRFGRPVFRTRVVPVRHQVHGHGHGHAHAPVYGHGHGHAHPTPPPRSGRFAAEVRLRY